MTLALSVPAGGPPTLRHISGFAECCGTHYYLAGDLDFDDQGRIERNLWTWEPEQGGLMQPQRPPGRRAASLPRDALVGNGVPWTELRNILIALSDECAANGFGAAARECDSANRLLRGLSAEAAAFRDGCLCADGGGMRALWAWRTKAVKPRGCLAAAERARCYALALAQYRYADGTPERAAAATLAETFPGSPDELLEVIAALHAEPQRLTGPR